MSYTLPVDIYIVYTQCRCIEFGALHISIESELFAEERGSRCGVLHYLSLLSGRIAVELAVAVDIHHLAG